MTEAEELELVRGFICKFLIKFDENANCLPMKLQVQVSEKILENTANMAGREHMVRCTKFFADFYEAFKSDFDNSKTWDDFFEEAYRVLEEISNH